MTEAARLAPHRTLVDAAALQAAIGRTGSDTAAAPWLLLDCGFDLGDSQAGERAFKAGHLPGAFYAHLERDLSGRKTGSNGRHPLPERGDWARCLGRWGIQPGVQVLTYDEHGGPYAARAWWLLRWMGHEAVAVLDGGRAAWLRAGGALVAGDQTETDSARTPYPEDTAAMPTIHADALQQAMAAANAQTAPLWLLDARAGARFRGETEPLDQVAGHIPGAINRFFKDNLAADGCFKSAAMLRQEFGALGLPAPEDAAGALRVVQQCGSGVTACHNLLAMMHAGWPATVLYPGSWSEWCSDARRPWARGA